MNKRITAEAFQSAIEHQLSGLRPDPALARRIMDAKKGETEMKRRITWTVAVAAVLFVMGVAVAAAEIAGFNVFSIFGKQDSRYAAIAPYTVLKTTSQATVASVELGKTAAGINSAYYDGQSLLVGYAIVNGSRIEAFTPDQDMLSKMTLADGDWLWAAANEAEEEIIAKWIRAKKAGEAMGVARYMISPSDHTETENGWDIAPCGEETVMGDDGIEYTIREYESPLEEALQNKEALSISIPLYQSVSYLYFDGAHVYTYFESQPLPQAMIATVWNANAKTNLYQGEGRYNSLELTAVARASAVNAVLEITFQDQPLPPVPDLDHWYVFRLTDETGAVLREREGGNGGEMKEIISYEGTGKLPEALYLQIYMEHEGDFNEEEALGKAETILLKLQR